MALSGLHVVCAYAGGSGSDGRPVPLMADIAWTQTMSAAGTTTNTAPSSGAASGRSMFRIRSSVDAWCSVGPTPDATTGKRFFVTSNSDYDVFASSGDKLAWVTA